MKHMFESRLEDGPKGWIWLNMKSFDLPLYPAYNFSSSTCAQCKSLVLSKGHANFETQKCSQIFNIANHILVKDIGLSKPYEGTAVRKRFKTSQLNS